MKPSCWRRSQAAASLVAALFTYGVAATFAHAQDSAADVGGQVYEYWCAPCHNPGPGHPGTQSLEFRYSGTGIPAVLMERTDLTPELIKTFVREGVLSMAPFRKTEITDDELDALAAYLTE